MPFENEFGEYIDDALTGMLVNEIMNMTPMQIDQLWSRCGWKDSERGVNEALPLKRITAILSKKSDAEEATKNLLLETRKDEVLKNLERIKNGN